MCCAINLCLLLPIPVLWSVPFISIARVSGVVTEEEENKTPELSNETYIVESIYYNSFRAALYSVQHTEISFIDCLCNTKSFSPPL